MAAMGSWRCNKFVFCCYETSSRGVYIGCVNAHLWRASQGVCSLMASQGANGARTLWTIIDETIIIIGVRPRLSNQKAPTPRRSRQKKSSLRVRAPLSSVPIRLTGFAWRGQRAPMCMLVAQPLA